ncbi:hypothetical protein HYW54_04590 [Candidatus Gottesmanbacteria bacterium]|nr:hypothetical protein [Candidatus Gottesmanbacteria bacterium]
MERTGGRRRPKQERKKIKPILASDQTGLPPGARRFVFPKTGESFVVLPPGPRAGRVDPNSYFVESVGSTIRRLTGLSN